MFAPTGDRRGTTLIELLVAAAFLAICAAIILQAVSGVGGTMAYSKRRFTILKLVQDKMDAARSTGRTAALAVGTNTTTSAIPTLSTSVTVTETIALVAGYANLYSVTETATWQEVSTAGTRNDSLTLTTYVEAPDG